MKFFLILFLGFHVVSIHFVGVGQQLEYDIIWLGKIGKLQIDKTDQDAYSTIETNSEVKIPFYRFNWITRASFFNGKLQTSDYEQLLNDEKREYTTIDQVNDSIWQIVNDAGKKEFISIKLQFNVSQLYFEEPVNEHYVFSERFGIPVEVEHKGKGQYRLLLPDKNYCDYFYEEGVCTTVKAKNGGKTIKFVLANRG